MQQDPQPIDAATAFRVGFFFELALVVPAVALKAFLGDDAFAFRIAFDLDCVRWLLFGASPLILLGAVFSSPLGKRLAFLRRIHERLKALLGSAMVEMSTEHILLLSAAAGVGEEVLFRGTLQNVLGPHGLWLQGVFFGALHALTPSYFVLATLMGWYFGWLHLAAGNLLVPILAHASYDAFVLILFRRDLQQEAAQR